MNVVLKVLGLDDVSEEIKETLYILSKRNEFLDFNIAKNSDKDLQRFLEWVDDDNGNKGYVVSSTGKLLADAYEEEMEKKKDDTGR